MANGPQGTGGSLAFLEHCHGHAAGGVQVGVGALTDDQIAQFRSRRESYGMFFEGQSSLPKDESDVARFEKDIRLSKEAGASVVRTAMLSGRRYETFDSSETFRQFAARSWNSLVLAEPVVRKQRVRLAIENHKDWRVAELLDLMKRISSEYVGICVDLGNSISLLEDPLEVTEAYAPWACSTHVKDMGVQEYEEGFLLSEVPLGEGILDLKRMIEIVRRAKPDVQFTLEMITRDPLEVPCLSRKYWATMETLPARDLARTIELVRSHPPRKPLPRVTGLSQAERVRFEDENVRKCLAFAREKLEL